MQLRPLSLTLHKYAGLAAGAVILVVGLTGAVLVFAEPLNRSLHPELWAVEVGTERISPDSALSLVRATGDRAANAINLPADPTQPYTVRLQGGVLVHLDPYRGRILGTLDHRRSFIGRVEELHTSLLAGRAGLWAVVGSTMVLLGLLLTGLVLWWPRTKKESKRSFTVEWRAGWKRFVYDGHNVFGFYAAGYVALIALTGLLLSFPVFTRAAYRLTRTDRPPGPPRSAVVADGTAPIRLGEALRVAEEAVAGGTAVSVAVPTQPQQAIRVGLAAADGGGDRTGVFVDQFSGAVLRIERPGEQPFVTRALALTFPIHSGNVLGLPTQVAACLASIVAGVLPLTGFLIWFPRWRARRRRRA